MRKLQGGFGLNKYDAPRFGTAHDPPFDLAAMHCFDSQYPAVVDNRFTNIVQVLLVLVVGQGLVKTASNFATDGLYRLSCLV